jgi:16S rRNA (cytosine1402-N4)-methyltransferase
MRARGGNSSRFRILHFTGKLIGTLEHMLSPAFIPASVPATSATDCLAVFRRVVAGAMPEWRARRCSSLLYAMNSSQSSDFYHEPVLMDEVLAALQPAAGKQFLDGTLGGGGHSERLLETGASVIGMDRDSDALTHAGQRLTSFGERFRTAQGNFSEMASVVETHSLDGVLLDLGVSSWQIDSPERGFSFQKEGPLDMRMDRSSGQTAADLVNTAAEAELAEIFWKFGEEKASRKIAAAIVRERDNKAFTSTLQLADFVEGVLGGRGRKHPATRVFQALRMAVNTELESVEEGLIAAQDVLKPGGVLAVITFHSLEDRLVKHFLRDRSTRFLDRPEWPEPKPNPDLAYDLLSRKAITGTAEEVARNPRARSAKLRIAQKR